MTKAMVLFALCFAAMCAPSPLSAQQAAGPHAAANATPATEFSSQQRRVLRRAPVRIEVRPLRGPIHRECIATFQERWIPQWGGRVLYAGQHCWWARG